MTNTKDKTISDPRFCDNCGERLYRWAYIDREDHTYCKACVEKLFRYKVVKVEKKRNK